MIPSDVAYMISVLQSYKEHTQLGIDHFAEKTTFTKMGGVSKLDLKAWEQEEIDGINKAAQDLKYYINRFQKELLEVNRKQRGE